MVDQTLDLVLAIAKVNENFSQTERLQRTADFLIQAVDSPQFDNRALKMQTHQKTRIRSGDFAKLASETITNRDIALSVLRLDNIDFYLFTSALPDNRFKFDYELLLGSTEILGQTKEALIKEYWHDEKVSQKIAAKLATSSDEKNNYKQTFLVDGRPAVDY